MNAVGDGIGERIFLRVDGAGLDRRNRLGQIPAQRNGAEEIERPGLHLARQDANAHAFEIGRHMQGAQTIRDVAEAVLEIAEDAIVHPRFDPLGQIFAERAVDRRARLIALFK
jgi:hypothetical protein